MVIVANLLLVASGLLLLALVSGRQRWGPEGPVGAHMLTIPLALGQCLGIALGRAPIVLAGVPAAVVFALLPGLLVALTALPILAGGTARHTWSRLAVVAEVAGALLLVNAGVPGAAIAGGVPVAVVALAGWGMLLLHFWQQQKNQIAAAQADAERQTEFEKNQAAWQLGEWQKLPAQPELWQLIQFAHAFHPEVQAECRRKITSLPDLSKAMQELLGTGWAEHALRTIRDCYPVPRGPLAAALSAFYQQEAVRWRSSLQGTNPGSWFYNLVTYLEVAELVAKDGGDVRACMAAWVETLQGHRGLEPLCERARRLATGGAS